MEKVKSCVLNFLEKKKFVFEPEVSWYFFTPGSNNLSINFWLSVLISIPAYIFSSYSWQSFLLKSGVTFYAIQRYGHFFWLLLGYEFICWVSQCSFSSGSFCIVMLFPFSCLLLLDLGEYYHFFCQSCLHHGNGSSEMHAGSLLCLELLPLKPCACIVESTVALLDISDGIIDRWYNNC